jgi:2-dehydro-3-deoxyphosphogalactonate aldolase
MSQLTLETALAEMPLIAILRGVKSEEIIGIADALYDAGFRVVEVPLNSPDPFASITALEAFRGRMIWGAGTVLDTAAVTEVGRAGGQLIVSPNTDPAVISASISAKLTPLPGFATATEAFIALNSGARYLKLFPASTYGPAHLKALGAVLPSEACVIPVGGVGPSQMAQWWQAGARAFGVGSELYKPGLTANEVRWRAKDIVAALHAAMR